MGANDAEGSIACDRCRRGRDCELNPFEFSAEPVATAGNLRRIDGRNGWLVSCPDYLRISPAINQAWEFLRWSKSGELNLAFPHGAPRIVLTAVDALRYGYEAGQCHALDKISGGK